jgi:beta-lactamase superfamily II metal-dependent hydrolase
VLIASILPGDSVGARLVTTCVSRASSGRPLRADPADVCGLRSGPVTAPRAAMAALDVEPDDVYIRIVDVGPGLCAVITVPGGSSMVYDAGHWNGEHCIKAVRELITGDAINLLVISHSDADHLGDGARILNEKRVRHTILAGEPRTTTSWRNLVRCSTSNLRSCVCLVARRSPACPADTTQYRIPQL